MGKKSHQKKQGKEKVVDSLSNKQEENKNQGEDENKPIKFDSDTDRGQPGTRSAHPQILGKVRSSADLEEEDHVVHAESPRDPAQLSQDDRGSGPEKLHEITNLVKNVGEGANGADVDV